MRREQRSFFLYGIIVYATRKARLCSRRIVDEDAAGGGGDAVGAL